MHPLLLGAIVSFTAVTLWAGNAFAQSGTCQDQADYLVANTNIGQQTGLDTADKFVASDQRLMLSVAIYTASVGQLRSDPSQQYFKNLLVVSDGLIRCFESDSERFKGAQRSQWRQFNEVFPKQTRQGLLARAAGQ